MNARDYVWKTMNLACNGSDDNQIVVFLFPFVICNESVDAVLISSDLSHMNIRIEPRQIV